MFDKLVTKSHHIKLKNNHQNLYSHIPIKSQIQVESVIVIETLIVSRGV